MLSVAMGVYHTDVPNLGVVSDTFSDRWLLLLSVAMGVYHTEVPNLGVVSDTFFLIGGYCCYQLLLGSNTQRSQILGWSVTLFSDRWLLLLSVAIGV